VEDAANPGMPASQMDSEQTTRDLGGRRNLLLAGSGWEPTVKIAARVSNTVSGHALEVETDGRMQSIAIAPKTAGRGSSVNGLRAGCAVRLEEA